MLKTCVLVLLTMMTFSCNRTLVHAVKLKGYQDGKLRGKYESKLSKTTLSNNLPGYFLQTDILISSGTKLRYALTYEALIDENFNLHSSKHHIENNKDNLDINTTVTQDQIKIAKTLNGKPQKEVVLPLGEGVQEIHPLLYGNDLKNAGDEATYHALLTQKGTIANMHIQFRGIKEVNKYGVQDNLAHYKIQDPDNPNEFDNYWLDPKTLQPKLILLSGLVFKEE